MSIPISASERKKWVDPDDGSTYYFCYLTGDKQDEFLQIQNAVMDAIKKAMPEARAALYGDAKYKKASVKDKAVMVAKKAQEIAQTSSEEAEGKSLKYSRAMIDIFLVNWEGKGFPDFPKDGKPSRMLRIDMVNKLSAVINGMIGELYGLSIEDSKN